MLVTGGSLLVLLMEYTYRKRKKPLFVSFRNCVFVKLGREILPVFPSFSFLAEKSFNRNENTKHRVMSNLVSG